MNCAAYLRRTWGAQRQVPIVSQFLPEQEQQQPSLMHSGNAIVWYGIVSCRAMRWCKKMINEYRVGDPLRLSPCGLSVKETVKHAGTYAVVHVALGLGGQIRAEAGAMVCMQNMASETVLAGPADVSGQVSCLPSLGRAFLGGQSLYQNVFRPATGEGGWVAHSPPAHAIIHEYMNTISHTADTCPRI